MSAVARARTIGIDEVVRHLKAGRPAVSQLAGVPIQREAQDVLGHDPTAWAAERAQTVVTSLFEESVFPTEASQAVVRRGAEAFLLASLLELVGARTGTAQEYETHHAVVCELAGYRVDPVPVTSCLRRAQQQWSGGLLASALSLGATSDLMAELTLAFAGCFDRFIDQQAQDQAIEERRIVNDGAEARRLLVGALVDGHEVDPAVVRSALGLDLRHVHVACAVRWGPTGVDRSAMGGTTEALARSLGATSVVRHEERSGVTWLWFSRPEGRRSPTWEVPAVVQPRVQVGFGSAQPGQAGFRRTLLEAVDALWVAEHGSHHVMRHEDAAFVALMGRDLERCRWFVTTNLRRLAADDREMAELRRTLLEYYRSGERLVSAAGRLHLHRNTLTHRLDRISRMLGRPLSGDTAALQGALVLRESLGDLVGS